MPTETAITTPATLILTTREYAEWLVARVAALSPVLSSHVRNLRVWEGSDKGIIRIYRGEDYVQVDCGDEGGHYGHALRAVAGHDRGFQAALRATGHLVVSYCEADGTIEVVSCGT